MTTAELARLEVLRRYRVLDTPPEEAFERITRLAARLFNVPIVLVSLVDRERQWFKSCYGLEVNETPRSLSFCAHAIEHDEVMVVQDARLDARFKDNALVTSEPHIRFYAGAPLATPDGFKLGSLCLIDRKPRPPLSAEEEATLQDLAAMVVDEFELRYKAQALEQLEAHNRTLVDNAPDAIYVMALDGTFLSLNTAFESITGYKAADWLGRSFAEIIHPDDLSAVVAAFEQVSKGETVRVEACLLTADNRYMVVDNVTVAHRQDGEIVSLLGFVRDVSAQRQAQEELRRGAQRIINILESITDAFFSLDADWRFTYLNSQAERLLLRRREELLGQTLWESFPATPNSPFETEYRRARESGETRTFEAYYAPLEITFEVHAYPSDDGIAVYFQNINHRKEAQRKERVYRAELEAKNAQLERASRLKSEFLANMSHELRTPLTAVNGFSELLESEALGVLSPKQKSYVQDIRASGEHLLNLINSILDMAKIEAGNLTLEPETLDPIRLVSEVIRLLRAGADSRRLNLLTDVPPTVSPLRADPIKLRQVLLNLLGNALKFTPTGGSITVRLRDAGDEVLFEVEDNGIGIREEDIPRLFQPFTQVDSSYTRHYEGAGLGLALTRQLVELHGGRVWVKSSLGKGSTFGFSLPRSL